MAPTHRADVAIVGTGFAGTLLARALHAAGRSVVLLERGAHPRFALGESTTPLANLALERLARRYGLDDLHQLATHGRWLRYRPDLRHGLKRGFTFYQQPTGRPFDTRARAPSRRLLVAASPTDDLADTQWLRSDVDAFFVERARAEGVNYLDHAELDRVELTGERIVVHGTKDGESLQVTARWIVDASGSGRFLQRALPLDEHDRRMPFTSRLIGGHFEGIPAFSEVVECLPNEGSAGEPHPESWAAVHHLLDLGWMYQLRFDHGTVSAGFLIDPERAARHGVELDDDPRAAFGQLLARHPSLARQFASSRPVEGPWSTGGLQRRATRAVGRQWILLPSTYAAHDPLFSTGIAWSLLAVERLAELLSLDTNDEDGQARLATGLERYQHLIDRECDHLADLIGAAYSVIDHFDRFAWLSQLYFIAASSREVRQRMLDPEEAGVSAWHWEGLLGADDAHLATLFSAATGQARGATSVEALARWVASSSDAHNLVGLASVDRHPLYPVELMTVVENAQKIGLDREQALRRLPRLRGDSAAREEP